MPALITALRICSWSPQEGASNAPGSATPTPMNISAKSSIRVFRESPDIAACFPKNSYLRTLKSMTAHLARHGRVNHTSTLFRPTLQRCVHRLEALTRGVKQATACETDQQAREGIGPAAHRVGLDDDPQSTRRLRSDRVPECCRRGAGHENTGLPASGQRLLESSVLSDSVREWRWRVRCLGRGRSE